MPSRDSLRCFGWEEHARPAAPDRPLWFSRPFQGDGRHDNPDLYGCLCLADRAVSCVVDQLGQRLAAPLPRRSNVTIFDRAAPPLAVREVRALTLEDPAVLEAAEVFALRVAHLARLS